MHLSWLTNPVVGLAGVAVGVGLLAAPAPDGTEALGSPGITIADGTGVVFGGVGTHNVQPVDLTIDVPAGVTIRQVLAYWDGQARQEAELTLTDTVMLGGQSITGDRISEPHYFYSNAYTATYRADITANALVTNGLNTLSVSGMDFSRYNNGLGLAVIVDDGSGAFPIDLRDGNDCAYAGFSGSNQTTTPVVYDFAPATADRTARVGHFVTAAFVSRPSVVSVRVDGVEVDRIVDALGSFSGEEWDTVEHDVLIPAGATSLSVEMLSHDDGTGLFAGNVVASFTWIYSSMVLAPEAADDFEGCKPRFWRSCRGYFLWNDRGDNEVTTTIKTRNEFNTVFGREGAVTGLSDWVPLYFALWDYSYGARSALNRHAVAALVNADADCVNYRYTVDEVIQMYQEAVDGVRDIQDTKNLFKAENERGCDCGFGQTW